MRKIYVDVYYDDEFSPPAWVTRRYYKEKDGSLVVFDADVLPSKREAEKLAKEWRMLMKRGKLKRVI